MSWHRENHETTDTNQPTADSDHRSTSGRILTTGRTLTAMSVAALMAALSAPAASASPLPADRNGDDADVEDGDPAETSEDEEPGNDEAGASEADSELMLVLDASASMAEVDSEGTPRIEAARTALHEAVDGLDEDRAVGFRVFSNEYTGYHDPGACEDSELVVPIDSNNHDELREAIDDYDAVGGRTPLAYAMEEAAADFEGEGQQTIILVSDGEENCVPDPCETAESIASQGIDVEIHTVGYNVEDEAREQLQCIAETAGGDYYDAEDSESLSESIEEISVRTSGDFVLEGEAVTGGDNWSEAPELETGAQYIDEFADGTLHYRIPREYENSSVHVGIATYDGDPDVGESVRMELSTWDSDRCTSAQLSGTQNSTRHFLRTAQMSTYPETNSDDPCYDEDELVLTVEPISSMTREGQEFQLTITEEPEATNISDLPEPTDTSNLGWEEMNRSAPGDGTEIVGANSFENAPILEPGTTYDGDLHPEEIQVFRVPVEWGENLQAEVFFPEPGNELSDQLLDNSVFTGLNILSPQRGSVDGDTSNLSFNSSRDMQAYTPEVRWRNTEDGGSANQAGYYYVVLSSEHLSGSDEFTAPYRLTIDTYGDAGEGEPEYPAGEELLYPGRDDDDGREDDDDDRSERDRDDRSREGSPK